MIRRQGIPVAVLAALLIAATAAGAVPPHRLVVQVFGGTVLNADSDLRLARWDEPVLEHRAAWETRSFEVPVYWNLRLRWQRADDAFELQLLHHKLYLANPTAEIRHLEVTHGFNIVSGHYVRNWRGFLVRAGVGVVLPKTDADLGGESGGTNAYRVQGLAILGGAGREWLLAGPVSLALEAQLIWAGSDIDVPGGVGEVTHLGLHLLAGLGVGF